MAVLERCFSLCTTEYGRSLLDQVAQLLLLECIDQPTPKELSRDIREEKAHTPLMDDSQLTQMQRELLALMVPDKQYNFKSCTNSIQKRVLSTIDRSIERSFYDMILYPLQTQIEVYIQVYLGCFCTSCSYFCFL